MLEKYKEIIKSLMSEKRYIHCLNVSRKAGELAKEYGGDIKKAKLAGLLHDITKERTPQEQFEMADKFGILVTNFEKAAIKLMHSKTGRAYVENILKIDDADLLNSISYHTTGRAGMSKLEKIIFLADFISDERDFEGVEETRKQAAQGLEEGVLSGLKYVIKEIADSEKAIHPDTIAAYNELTLKKENNRE